MSLLQPPPEVFALFDDVLLLAEGRVVYHGPTGGAVPFFASLGLACPERKDVPSFLLEVTTPAGQAEYATPELRARRRSAAAAAEGGGDKGGGGGGEKKEKEESGGKRRPPLWRPAGQQQLLVTMAEAAAHFRAATEEGRAAEAELAAPPDPAAHRDATPGALHAKPYAVSTWRALVEVTRRQLTLVSRDRLLLRGRVVQVCVLATILGSLFLDVPATPPGGRTILGASFMSVLFMVMGSFPQMPVVQAQKGCVCFRPFLCFVFVG